MSVTEERIKVRVGHEQTHYWDDMAAGAFVLQLFGDVGGALNIRNDGTGGLLAGYDQVDLLYPVRAGDLIEVVARLEHVGNRSRKISYEAYLHLSRFDDNGQPGRWREFDPPKLVARARGTAVIPRDQQFGGPLRVNGLEE